jgi:p-aminobenzoyl-glutamate transporter AbgT
MVAVILKVVEMTLLKYSTWVESFRKYSSSSILMVGCTNILTSVGVGGGVTIEPSLLLSCSIERVSGSESSSWTPLLLK